MGIRFLEADSFLSSQFLVDGERMLATHDGYAFLAGAESTSRYVIESLSGMMSFFRSVTGMSLGDLGFWLPPLFSGLAALPVCLAAARAGRPEAGAAAGVMAATCFGFYIRSRFGFLDTDVLTLFFAYGTSAGFILWLAPQVRSGWLPEKDEAASYPLHLAIAGAALLGLFLYLYLRFYSSGRPLVLAILMLMGLLGLLLARRGNRTGVLMGLAVILAGLDFGWISFAVSSVLAAAARKKPEAVRSHHVGTVVAAVTLALLAVRFLLPNIATYYELVLVYLDLGGRELAQDFAAPGLALPSVISTVREAKRVPLEDILWLMAGKGWLFWFCAAGYVWAVVRRPLLLAFLPLLGLALASFALGTRFAMYGGAAMGLGLAFLVADGVALATDKRVLRYAAQGAVLALVSVVLALPTKEIRPSGVLSPAFAETLKELDSIAAKDAVVWQWWDYGYAAQYYAKRDSYGDGGRHSGDWLFPMALAHASTSVSQAANIIKFTAADIADQVQLQKERGVEPYPPAKIEFYGVNPVRKFSGMGGSEAMKLVKSMVTAGPELPAIPPEQYFVVTWENMPHLSVISSFGNWDLERGKSVGGKSSPVPGGAVDFKRGIVRSATGQTAQLSGITVIDQKGKVRSHDWMRFGAPYAVGNMATGEMYMMDSRIYNSMMVRMLLDNPSDFEPHFTLVVDKGPWCRAYRVN